MEDDKHCKIKQKTQAPKGIEETWNN